MKNVGQNPFCFFNTGLMFKDNALLQYDLDVFGEVAVIFQVLASLTQFYWQCVTGMSPDDSGPLE